jgi:hypothetical protein
MKTKIFITGMLVACLVAVCAVPAEAATARKAGITKAVNFVKKTANDISNTIWNNKGAIAVSTAAVAVATQPEILAKPITAATTAVATETSRAAYSSPIGTIGVIFLFAAALVIVSGIVCVARHYLKLWHIVPLLAVGVCLISCGVADAATVPLPMIASQLAAIKPVLDVLGWVVIIAFTIFM